MERRRLLGTLSALGAGAIAGCSSAPNSGNDDGNDGDDGSGSEDGSDGGGGNDGSDGGDGSNGSDSGGGDDGDGGAEETTDDGGDAGLYIAQAVSTLNTVALRLNKLEDELDAPEDVEFDQQTLLDGIADARGNLDTASETATETQAAQIETLSSLATVLEELTQVVGIVLSVDPETVVEDATAAIDAADYDAALSQVRDAKAKASDAMTRTKRARTALEGVDADRLAAVDGVEYARIESAVTELSALVNAFQALTVGYEASILGTQDLEAGRSHSEDREFEAAESAFGDANAHFETGDEALAGVAANAPERLRGPVEVAACRTTHLLQAATALRDGAADAADGNRAAAKEHRDEGEAQIQQAENCGSN
jgi:hypothetical protein